MLFRQLHPKAGCLDPHVSSVCSGTWVPTQKISRMSSDSCKRSGCFFNFLLKRARNVQPLQVSGLEQCRKTGDHDPCFLSSRGTTPSKEESRRYLPGTQIVLKTAPCIQQLAGRAATMRRCTASRARPGTVGFWQMP